MRRYLNINIHSSVFWHFGIPWPQHCSIAQNRFNINSDRAPKRISPFDLRLHLIDFVVQCTPDDEAFRAHVSGRTCPIILWKLVIARSNLRWQTQFYFISYAANVIGVQSIPQDLLLVDAFSGRGQLHETYGVIPRTHYVMNQLRPNDLTRTHEYWTSWWWYEDLKNENVSYIDGSHIIPKLFTAFDDWLSFQWLQSAGPQENFKPYIAPYIVLPYIIIFKIKSSGSAFNSNLEKKTWTVQSVV